MPDCAIFAVYGLGATGRCTSIWLGLRSPNVLPFPVHVVRETPMALILRDNILARRNTTSAAVGSRGIALAYRPSIPTATHWPTDAANARRNTSMTPLMWKDLA